MINKLITIWLVMLVIIAGGLIVFQSKKMGELRRMEKQLYQTLDARSTMINYCNELGGRWLVDYGFNNETTFKCIIKK